MKFSKTLLLAATIFSLSACNAFDRLVDIGDAPTVGPVEDPSKIANPNGPVSMPTHPVSLADRQPNSLWKTGSRTFFRDQRATRVGDILTVVISLDEKAQLQNETKRSRDESDTAGAPHLFGLESALDKVLPAAFDASNMVETSSKMNHDGKGSVDRSEKINLRIAVTITQVLPNGNLVLAGKQQMMVNYDLRELLISGVIRPEDISSDNTVTYDQIAEARISYGGRGSMQDIQQPRYGSQLVDIVMPF